MWATVYRSRLRANGLAGCRTSRAVLNRADPRSYRAGPREARRCDDPRSFSRVTTVVEIVRVVSGAVSRDRPYEVPTKVRSRPLGRVKPALAVVRTWRHPVSGVMAMIDVIEMGVG